MMRLQKYLADCGVASRRGAEALIRQGRVQVNGITVTEMGTQVDEDHDEVFFDGQKVKPESKMVYILLNKPVGYVTTVSDDKGPKHCHGSGCRHSGTNLSCGTFRLRYRRPPVDDQ